MKDETNKLSCAQNGGSVRNDALATSPFVLENETAYQQWRRRKLAAFRKDFRSASEPVPVADPDTPGEKALAVLTERCRRRNFAFYRIDGDVDKTALKRFWGRLGLHALSVNPCAGKDGISHVAPTPGIRYIPYTTRRLTWHTDGYYNTDDDEVLAFAMHCVFPADEGGENQYFDPEILYILLRDENPDYVTALRHPTTIIVPHNAEELPSPDAPRTAKQARAAPVLALHRASGDVIMRYTERRNYIAWRKDGATAAARTFIRDVLRTRSEYRVERRLDGGEGVVCNNVLHNRSSFTPESGKGPERLLYRARYRERITGTGYATLTE